MALNVNIIGRDSEGNLQALKVNSEGNLEISDSLGWGELLQGISDKTGILALIKSELDNIKQNQTSGDQKVQLSGNPVPQYKRPGSTDYEAVEGQHGAPFATLKDASGNVVSPATEAKLEQVRALLSGVATENTLEQARTLLDAISTKDFATSSKQDALNIAVEDLLAKLEQARVLLSGVATETKLEEARALLESVAGKDFATQATLAQVKSELELVKAELAAIKANQLSGDQKVQLSGTKVVESAPVTGIKTITSTVAEVFAGSSRKANRSKLVIRNLHQAIPIRIGGSGITDTIGQSLEPGASVEIDFSPSTTVSIYAVSTAGNVSVEVLEV